MDRELVISCVRAVTRDENGYSCLGPGRNGVRDRAGGARPAMRHRDRRVSRQLVSATSAEEQQMLQQSAVILDQAYCSLTVGGTTAGTKQPTRSLP
ncbi:MAG TPA: hypothetical protein VG815_20960 [Chloroflexota bacterium]|jgi:hypothetical protein|nr:hypothetical protein [Chloroflexota bacterium]